MGRSLAGIDGAGVFSFVPDSNVVSATTASLTVYVDASGSDSNPGTQALPFQTIERALDSLPKMIRHPTVVSIGTGSYSGSLGPCGFTIAPLSSSLGAWLSIIGSMGNPALVGSITGTVSAATAGSHTLGTFGNWGTLTASANPNWSPNECRGLYVAIVSGTGNGQTRIVAANNSSDLTILGAWTVTPDVTSGFEIQRPVTTVVGVTGAVAANPDGVALTTTSQRCFTVFNNRTSNGFISNRLQGDIMIENMIFSASLQGDRAVDCQGGTLLVKSCMAGSNINMVHNLGGGEVMIEDCVISCSFTPGSGFGQGFNGAILLRSVTEDIRNDIQLTRARRNFYFKQLTPFNYFGDVGFLVIESDMWLGEGTGGHSPYIQYSTGDLMNVQVFGTYISGTQHGFVGPNNSGFSFANPQQMITVSNCRGDNNGAIADVRGPGTVFLSALTGSGNGVICSMTKGAKVLIASTVPSMPNTTDLSIDGTIVTLAAMRANSPPYATGSLQSVFGTIAFQNG